MSKVYVPGYGYVDSAGPGTRGSVRPPTRNAQGQVIIDTGQGTTRPVGGNNAPSGFRPRPPTSTPTSPAGTPTQSSMSSAYGVDAGDPIVSFPNLSWYYSSADVYGSQDPADPRSTLNQGVEGEGVGGPSPMWNFGLAPSEAEKAYDDDTLVPPGLREILDAVAKSIHPMKGGRSLWEESVAASALASQRGEYVSPYSIIRNRYLSGSEPEAQGDGSSSYTSGGGGYGGGGGGGATSERIDLASPTQAQALLTQFMQASVGRNPKANEVSKFLDLLQEYQRNNPTVVSAAGSTVTQSGGIDAGVVAQEFVETLPDYTESQADRYYRSFMSALLGGG
jgi:hypothetical protein